MGSYQVHKDVAPVPHTYLSTMAKTKLMPRSTSTQPRHMSAAAKRSDRTSTFLDEVDQALTILDDEVTSLSVKQQQHTYHNLATTYKQALTAIWDKASTPNIKAIMSSVDDKELHELRRMAQLLESHNPQSKVMKENRNVPSLNNIQGAMTNRLPTKQLQPDICQLIETIFSDLSEAHRHQMNTAKGIADLSGLVTLQQLSLILAAAVPPTLHLVLPPGTVSPLTASPPLSTMMDTVAGQQDIVNFCKAKILPNPKAADFLPYDKKSPTRVLAAALYCQIEKKYFKEKTSRADIMATFKVTTAQLMKVITGVDYESGPHTSTKKRKVMDADSTTPAKPTEPQAGATSTPTTLTLWTNKEETTGTGYGFTASGEETQGCRGQ